MADLNNISGKPLSKQKNRNSMDTEIENITKRIKLENKTLKNLLKMINIKHKQDTHI